MNFKYLPPKFVKSELNSEVNKLCEIYTNYTVTEINMKIFNRSHAIE